MCLLTAVCRLLSADCCLLTAVCWLLYDVCWLLFAVCCLLTADCCLLTAVCCLLSTVGNAGPVLAWPGLVQSDLALSFIHKFTTSSHTYALTFTKNLLLFSNNYCTVNSHAQDKTVFSTMTLKLECRDYWSQTSNTPASATFALAIGVLLGWQRFRMQVRNSSTPYQHTQSICSVPYNTVQPKVYTLNSTLQYSTVQYSLDGESLGTVNYHRHRNPHINYQY
jgi:hypothetical protein